MSIDSKRSLFVTRWRKILRERTVLDHQMAGLAQEIRQEFPPGASGNHQFVAWVRAHLEVTGSRARKLLDAARAYTLFPSQTEWDCVSGWASIVFLLGLNQSGRRKTFRAAQARSQELGRPISLHTVRAIAFELGVTTRRRTGRPTRSKSEETVVTLRSYLVTLYRDYGHMLPKPPRDVKRAMAKTNLETVAQG